MGNTRAALVTGSTSGIGQAIAEHLAAAGYSVMLNGLGDKQDIEKFARQLEEKCGVKIGYHAADMRRPQEIAEMVEATQNQLGSLDVLVNNAGVQHVSPIEAFPVEKYDEIIAINMSSAWHATRASVVGMKGRGWGRIVNIASVHGLVGSANKTAYCMAKFGVIGMTKAVALELAEHGITCNAICPGWVLTPLVQKQVDDLAAQAGISEDEAARRLLELKQPTRQFIGTDKIARAVEFLCSDYARDITGSEITIDGGWTAQ